MSAARNAYTPVSNPILRWLTDPGPLVPASIRTNLLAELFTTQRAVLMGVVNGLVLNVVALCQHTSTAFLCLVVIDIVLAVARVAVLRHAVRALGRGAPTPTDLLILSAILWCTLQGMIAFTAMQTGIFVLQILSATTIMSLLGPIAARNYPAPRLALLLILACDLPFVAGGVLSGDPWLLVLVLQTPLYLVGTRSIYSGFQAMTIERLQAQHDSQERARHDPLTGLLNRRGLSDELTGANPATVGQAGPRRFTLFYLDLDGFKQVNDTFGHHAGDSLLQGVAQRLRASIRGGDIVARLGGDEFMILANDMTPAEGGRFADSIIRRISDQPYLIDPIGDVRVGVSIGYACAPDDGVGFESLQRRADAALYEVKASGKGAQRRFVPVEPVPMDDINPWSFTPREAALPL